MTQKLKQENKQNPDDKIDERSKPMYVYAVIRGTDRVSSFSQSNDTLSELSNNNNSVD